MEKEELKQEEILEKEEYTGRKKKEKKGMSFLLQIRRF